MNSKSQYETGDRDILIIDDEDGFRAFYRDALRRRGYTTEEARDGREGFRYVKNNQYGLVITDMRMPEWDGLEFVISAGLTSPNQKILVIDELPAETIEQLEIESNVVGWLQKPVTEEQLLREVEKYVKPSEQHT